MSDETFKAFVRAVYFTAAMIVAIHLLTEVRRIADALDRAYPVKEEKK